ncbi:MAG: aminopeptidase N [Gammaproteobacteria bacterium]|nr:aminopeptidase N [Gammaproteobacteria bacterium]
MSRESNRDARAQPVLLQDYTPPAYRILSTELTFELLPARTVVRSRLRLEAAEGIAAGTALRLDGESLELLSLAVNGQPLNKTDYEVDECGLTLLSPPPSLLFECEVAIEPDSNSALEGLYISGGIFTTQCEAEGFRRITYYIDRPDVMALFTTRIIASRSSYPVLLANGNCIEKGELEDGRHFALWHDPFPKPCYLFALVAGRLHRVSDTFTTASGRNVALEIYVEPGNEKKCDHAMRSLKKAMAWDEQRYGLEYDLDIYMIVAVSDFNMGAMENKGLNVFNAGYVMACPETATDNDYLGIEGVIAHEYFHNWSGNRVTCRDWFQLSLKEGFTVFRDQQFSAEMNSAAVKRIDDVRLLRTYQFAEDAGPIAHPVRPDSYYEINNFYTLTVYEKGAELIRMIHTLLGEEGFRKGSDLYFQRHDGQAVTCDELVAAMADANGRDFSRFSRWYSQKGTPRVKVSRSYNGQEQRLQLTIEQLPPSSANSERWQWLPIPFTFALFSAEGDPLPLDTGSGTAAPLEMTLSLEQQRSEVVIENIPPGSVPSLLRNFSAPVKLESDISDRERALLMAHDSDPFNRWDVGQQLAETMVITCYHGSVQLDPGYAEAFGTMLADMAMDPALKSESLALPDILYLLEQIPAVDPQQLYRTLKALERELVDRYRKPMIDLYLQLQSGDEPFGIDAESMGQRRLKNRMLSWLAGAGDSEAEALVLRQFEQSSNMTDALAALTHIVHYRLPQRQELLQQFYQRWESEPLVIDKWFAIQATTPDPEAVDEVLALRRSPRFNLRNPNRVRSLVASFGTRNPNAFHSGSGEGYRFMADTIIELDRTNPQIASRLMTPLTLWKRYEEGRSHLMYRELERILSQERLSRDLREVVEKSVAREI